MGSDVDEWVRDERELVRRCREGSDAAYAALVRLHRPRLYGLAYRLLLDREAAEDVVQETFLAAFRQIERFEPRPSLAAWLNTIALRTASRAASRHRARPRASLDAPNAALDAGGGGQAADQPALVDARPGADPHAAAEAADLRREVAAAIAALPFKYRAAVVLRHVMGLEYADAARALDLPLNTYKSHLLRGTRLLREALAAEVESRAVPLPGAGNAAAAPRDGRRPSDVRRGAALAERAAGERGVATERSAVHGERASGDRLSIEPAAAKRIARH